MSGPAPTTADASPAPRPVSLAEMNGRLAEIEAQRNAAQVRCAVLAGEKAEVIDLLRQSQCEIDRLNAIVAANAAATPPDQPGAAALN